ncbi:hypothetical protein C9374_006266 [Naegleria lovaniensis]|uniref:Uncharacterized protein n=1 Tax=Naegleria lovaniensis TaxID=51637 RepID=A0AA88GMZ3_NAELO|nr:uncharacterized protein C9374_006266 [Naegleria lovaniensis]KAG2381277.1 hypothetical protein C9374_006266 [Naegleria lovaniensis]
MARGSSSKSSSSKTKESSSSSATKTDVPLSWNPLRLDQVIIPSQTKPEPSEGADVQVLVKSRQVKGLTTCPSDCLFRTHQYEFVITPSIELLQWAGCKFGYYAMIKLFTNERNSVSHGDGANSEPPHDHDDHWVECFSDDNTPVVLQSFMEDYDQETVWKITMYWPTSSNYKFNSKALFRFEIDVFRANAASRDEMKKVATKISSSFRVLSKPEVYLKGIAKPKKSKSSKTTNSTVTNRQKKNSSKRKKTSQKEEEEEGITSNVEDLDENNNNSNSNHNDDEPPHTKLKTEPPPDLVLESGEAFFSFPASPPLFSSVLRGSVATGTGNTTPQSPILSLRSSSATATGHPTTTSNSSDLNISSLSTCSDFLVPPSQQQQPSSSSQEFFNLFLTPPLSQQQLQTEEMGGDSFFNAELPSLSQSSNNIPSQ